MTNDNDNRDDRRPRKPFGRPHGGDGPKRSSFSSGDRPVRKYGRRDDGESEGRAGAQKPWEKRQDGPRPERSAPRGDRKFDSPREGSRFQDRKPPRREQGSDGKRDGFRGGPRRDFQDRNGQNRNVQEKEPVVVLPSEPLEERIAKVIARAGLASRRDAEAMIAEGRVVLNGRVLTSPAINVTAKDVIVVDGEPLPAKERTRLWLYHKPRGLVTTARDPEGRPTVFEQLPEEMPRVVSIGRLDINTEGLLLLTNDGGLARVIAHPETGWLRRYRVRANGDITQASLDPLRNGLVVDEMEYGPIEAQLDRVQGDNVWITMGLREGKNREVKKILEHLGLRVNRLIRLSFGPFQLADLESGLVEEVRTRVLKDQLGAALAAEAEVDFESPVREPIAPFGSTKPARPERRQDFGDRPQFRRDSPGGGRGDERERAPPKKQWDRFEAKRSVWRAGDEPRGEGQADGQRPLRKSPRREDPKSARFSDAQRPRERVGAFAKDGRKVMVERVVAPPKEEHRPARREDARTERPRKPREGFSGRERPQGRDQGRERFDDRGPRRGPSEGAGERDFGRSKGPPRGGPKGPPRGGDAGRGGGFKGGGSRGSGGPGGGFKGGPRGGSKGPPRGPR